MQPVTSVNSSNIINELHRVTAELLVEAAKPAGRGGKNKKANTRLVKIARNMVKKLKQVKLPTLFKSPSTFYAVLIAVEVLVRIYERFMASHFLRKGDRTKFAAIMWEIEKSQKTRTQLLKVAAILRFVNKILDAQAKQGIIDKKEYEKWNHAANVALSGLTVYSVFAKPGLLTKHLVYTLHMAAKILSARAGSSDAAKTITRILSMLKRGVDFVDLIKFLKKSSVKLNVDVNSVLKFVTTLFRKNKQAQKVAVRMLALPSAL